MAYMVHIDDSKEQGRQIIKFLEPERQRVLADLDKMRDRMREMMDGRDLRANYEEIITTAKWIVRLQKAGDIMGGYKVDIDAGRMLPEDRRGAEGS